MNPNLNRDEMHLRRGNKIFGPVEFSGEDKVERPLVHEAKSITQAKRYGRENGLKVVTKP